MSTSPSRAKCLLPSTHRKCRTYKQLIPGMSRRLCRSCTRQLFCSHWYALRSACFLLLRRTPIHSCALLHQATADATFLRPFMGTLTELSDPSAHLFVTVSLDKMSISLAKLSVHESQASVELIRYSPLQLPNAAHIQRVTGNSVKFLGY
jgi:hypothetical protein